LDPSRFTVSFTTPTTWNPSSVTLTGGRFILGMRTSRSSAPPPAK
jgi:hypothetical protein